MSVHALSSGRAKGRRMPVPAPPAAMTAQRIAEYFTAVLGSAGGREWRAARRERPGREVFVSERGAVHLSSELAAEAIRSGLLASVVNAIADVLPLDKGTVLRAIGIDKATLGRRIAKRAELDPAQAEAALRTMELTTLATEAFGTLEKAALWLKK